MRRIIAGEEHIATDAFLDTAHCLDVVPGERTETGLVCIVERQGPVREAQWCGRGPEVGGGAH
ncbi:hypothetical protein [Streptomyces halstedii]|uniref:hypothetical protein n=1 Tax=Streptomyces halstedii TaxID=1944 RepID=UPI0037F8F3BF